MFKRAHVLKGERLKDKSRKGAWKLVKLRDANLFLAHSMYVTGHNLCTFPNHDNSPDNSQRIIQYMHVFLIE